MNAFLTPSSIIQFTEKPASVSARQFFARFIGICALTWTAVQILDRFFMNVLPHGQAGVVLTVLCIILLCLGIEAVVANVYITNKDRIETNDDPAEAFANGIVSYAGLLHKKYGMSDHQILDLRRIASRTLHLIGAHQQRIKLGMFAYDAAVGLGDRDMIAEILIDDLGWARHEVGEDSLARTNILDAVSMLENSQERDDKNRSLAIKGQIHIINICSSDGSTEVDDNLHTLTKLREEVKTIQDPQLKTLETAQLWDTEARVILQYIERELGKEGKIDPTGKYQEFFAKALEATRVAEQGFNDLMDKERKMKTLAIRCRLLGHSNEQARLERAKSEFSRIEREVERRLQ